MKTDRPINLQISTMRMPITAIVSILHRLSGLALFIFLPFVLWGLGLSLSSAAGYAKFVHFLGGPVMRAVAWFLSASLIYHCCAGTKHLLMDMGWGETKRSGRVFSFITLLIAAALMGWVGCLLW